MSRLEEIWFEMGKLISERTTIENKIRVLQEEKTGLKMNEEKKKKND